ncbi:hypothetical protein AT03_07965 [Hafnia alvei FB1]|uniref:ATPase AAA-type core domain-containing protein n=1 Tax=Hafnia alvei FB1 TaxID=1453496 RepID=A0A097R0S3_HAFAL|nr:AAA family ATPase [Hafnia alvei]AIU72329.1 hypothetical protein AT03_07965 [Hafnia alvei FB1]TBL61248.1 ATP-binding protein [Hafnia alvei]
MLEKIIFKSGSTSSEPPLEVSLSPLTIFVGPNNSGKSRALIEIENKLSKGDEVDGDIISEITIRPLDVECIVNDLESIRRMKKDHENIPSDYVPIEKISYKTSTLVSDNINLSQLLTEAVNPNIRPRYSLAKYLSLYLMRLDGQSRLSLINEQNSVDLQQPSFNNLASIFKDNNEREKIRAIVFDAFGKYFVIDPTKMGSLRIRLSDRAPLNETEEKGWGNDSVDFHSQATLISEASDGVKAFVGMMITLIAGSPKITLIDEPEAFLHPSLSSKLGKEITKIQASTDKNVFISTHSASFLMGCVQGGVSLNIVRLTYDGKNGTARVLTKEQLIPLMRNPLLRSIGVLNALFYNYVIVTEADADRAFYQEINERLLLNGDSRGIEGCLFLNAQNKQTVWDIVKPLRELGIPSVGIVDIDVLKEGGVVWKKPMNGAFIPEIRHSSLNTEREALKKAFELSGMNMKTDGGVSILSPADKEACLSFFSGLEEYGVFVVPIGEVEAWLHELEISRNKGTWLTNIFEKMGADPMKDSYVMPSDGDVWDFIGRANDWFRKSNRKGIPV